MAVAALERQLTELLQQKRELKGRLAHKEEEYQETILTLRNSLEDSRTKVPSPAASASLRLCLTVKVAHVHTPHTHSMPGKGRQPGTTPHSRPDAFCGRVCQGR